jgi:hypothetical protein
MARLPDTARWRERYDALNVPSWVPDDVRFLVREQWGNQSGDAERTALIERLLVDPRMEAVWHELLRRDRQTGDHKHLSEALKKHLGSARANEVFRDSTAMVFRTAVQLGVGARELSKQKSIHYFERANDLRTDARLLRGLNKEHRFGGDGREVSKLVDDLDKAAAAYDRLNEMAGLRTAGSRLFDSPQLIAKGFVVTMAKTMRGLFGASLYRTLTTIARVALQDDSITEAAVRAWCTP